MVSYDVEADVELRLPYLPVAVGAGAMLVIVETVPEQGTGWAVSVTVQDEIVEPPQHGMTVET